MSQVRSPVTPGPLIGTRGFELRIFRVSGGCSRPAELSPCMKKAAHVPFSWSHRRLLCRDARCFSSFYVIIHRCRIMGCVFLVMPRSCPNVPINPRMVSRPASGAAGAVNKFALFRFIRLLVCIFFSIFWFVYKKSALPSSACTQINGTGTSLYDYNIG